jgi:hypothetical protein
MKLLEIKLRLNTMIGDCIILAASVVFLGVFSFKERMSIRKDIVTYLEKI